MIHKYKLMDFHIVLDINSGAVHVVDEIIFDILDLVNEPLQPTLDSKIMVALMGKYPQEDIDAAYKEVYALYKAEHLFSSDDYGKFAESMIKSPVKAMCLNVSHDCNLRCEYCFAGKGDYDQGRMVMTEQTGKKAIDFLLENSGDREFLELDFFGGEPLMNFDVVKKVVEYARSKEKLHNKIFRFTITTNGVLLDDDKIDYINKEMSNVVLSLDGRKDVNDKVRTKVDGSGSYDRVVGNFQKLVKGRGDKEYYVRGTFTQYNKDFTKDVFALNQLGFDQISVEPVVSNPKEPYALTEKDLPEIFSEYEKLAEKILKARKDGNNFNFFHYMMDLDQGPCAIKRLRGCGCGNEYVAITPDGDIYPCHQFIGHDAWKMGSLYEGTFDEDMKTKFSNLSIYNKDDCKECWAKFYCSGGCSANNMQYENDILKAHKLSCEIEKKRVECAIAMIAAQA